MDVAAPSSPSPLEGHTKVDQNGASPIPSQPATGTPNSAMLMAMVTPGLLTQPLGSPDMYPAPLAKHKEVVASKELFLETLNKFHTTLGTRLAIPKMGGKDLDLQVLYIEVTQRGGLQQVIKDRKWKEITGVFNFPRTTTSASYVLRKYYITLLHHYEQAYFFGATGSLIPPPTPLPAPSPVVIKKNEFAPILDPQVQEEEPEVDASGKKIRKRKLTPIQMTVPVDPTTSIGHIVTGAIEGKFEHGYLVTVMVGTEKLRGVLYHVPPAPRHPQHAYVPNYTATVGAEIALPPPEVRARRKRRQKEDQPKKDPNAPRANRTGYNFFFAEERAKLKILHPDKERELSRMIGDAWNNLSEEEKFPYQDRGVKDKERYKREMREYKEQLRNLKVDEGATLEEHEEAAEAENATDGDHDYHVAVAESEPEAPSAPVIQHTFNLDHLPQMQNANPLSLAPPQQYIDAPQINLGMSPFGPPVQQPYQVQDYSSQEGNQQGYGLPTPQQFMG